MKELFVIDGTNLINVLSPNTEPEERKLGGLLQLLLELIDRKDSFFCYFDASTRFMFKEGSYDRQMYDILIGLRISDYFEQVQGGVLADKLVLKQADETNSRVISMDTFSQFYEEFPWTERDKEHRLIPADIIQNHLRLDKLDIKLEMIEKQTKEMTLELINILEGERGNLVGIIKKYDTTRRFGLIKRAKGGPTLLFHKRQVIDDNLDYTIIGQAVEFKVGFRFNKGKQMIDFCAADIKETESFTDENPMTNTEKLEQFQRENIELKELSAGLRKRNRELNNIINELRTEDELKVQMLEEKDDKIEALEAEIKALKAAQKQAESTHETQLEQSRVEQNELAIALDMQEQKIKNLDHDLKETLYLFKHNKIDPTEVILYEKLKQNYSLLQYSMKQKEARIVFLRNNIQALHDELETTKSDDSPVDTAELLSKIEQLENSNRKLESRLENLKNDASALPIEEKNIQLFKTIKNNPSKRFFKTDNISENDAKNWWLSLSDEWQMAFNKVVLMKEETTTLPNFEELISILKLENLEIIGERIFFGGFNRLTFRLKDFSGLSELRFLENINLSGHDIKDWNGLENLSNLKSINLTSNNLKGVAYNPAFQNVSELILRDNLLDNLSSIESFKHLEYLDLASNEKLHDLKALDNLEKLEILQVGYAPNLERAIIRLKMLQSNLEIRQ